MQHPNRPATPGPSRVAKAEAQAGGSISQDKNGSSCQLAAGSAGVQDQQPEGGRHDAGEGHDAPEANNPAPKSPKRSQLIPARLSGLTLTHNFRNSPPGRRPRAAPRTSSALHPLRSSILNPTLSIDTFGPRATHQGGQGNIEPPQKSRRSPSLADDVPQPAPKRHKSGTGGDTVVDDVGVDVGVDVDVDVDDDEAVESWPRCIQQADIELVMDPRGRLNERIVNAVMAMLAAQRSEWRTIDCTLLLPTLGEALPAAQVQQFHDPGIVIFLPIKAPPGHWVLGILVARSRTAILVDSEPLDPQPLDQHRAMAADRRAVAAKVMGGFVSRYLPEGWNKPEVWAYYTKLGPKLEHAHDSGVYMIASAFHLGHRDKMPATLHLREWRMLIAALMPRITSPTLDLDPNACCEGGAGAAVAPPLKPPPLPFDQDDYLNINFQFMIPSEGTPAPAGLCNMDIYSEELKRRIDLHAGFVRDMVVPGWEHLRRAMSETDDRLNAVREVEAAIPELEGDLGVDIELLAIGKRLRHLEQQTAPGQGQQAGPSNLDSLSARLRYLKSRHFAAAAWGRRVVGLGIPSAIKKLLKLANEQDSLEKQMALGAGWPPLTYDEEEAESRRRSRSSESSSSEVPSLQSVSKSHGTLASGSHLYIGN